MIKREQKTIDATDKVPGRMASQVAALLIGKHKTSYQANVDGGDKVEILNVGKMKFSGKKIDKEVYYRYTGYPGGIIKTGMKELFLKNPKKLFWSMVYDMLPKNRLRRARIKRLTFGK